MVLKVLWIKILFIKLTNSSKHSLILAKTYIEVLPLEPFLVFQQRTCPIHYFRSKTHVLDGFVPFCCHTRPAMKIIIGVHLKHEFLPRKPFLVWYKSTSLCLGNHFLFGRNEHYQCTTLCLKLMFTILLDTSMHFYIAFDNS